MIRTTYAEGFKHFGHQNFVDTWYELPVEPYEHTRPDGETVTFTTVSVCSSSPIMPKIGDVFVEYSNTSSYCDDCRRKMWQPPFQIVGIEEYYKECETCDEDIYSYKLEVRPISMFRVWLRKLFDPTFDLIQFGG